MSVIKTTANKIKNNPIGLLIGAGAGFLVAKKIVKTDTKWKLIVAAVIGGVAGALAQDAYKAKKGTVTASTVAAPAAK